MIIGFRGHAPLVLRCPGIRRQQRQHIVIEGNPGTGGNAGRRRDDGQHHQPQGDRSRQEALGARRLGLCRFLGQIPQFGREQGVDGRLHQPGADQDHQHAAGGHQAEFGKAGKFHRGQRAENQQRGAARGHDRGERAGDAVANGLDQGFAAPPRHRDLRGRENPVVRAQPEQDGEKAGRDDGQMPHGAERQRQTPERPEPHRHEDGKRPGQAAHHQQDQAGNQTGGGQNDQPDVLVDIEVFLILDGRHAGQDDAGRRPAPSLKFTTQGVGHIADPVVEGLQYLEILGGIAGMDEEKHHPAIAGGKIAARQFLGPNRRKGRSPLQFAGRRFGIQPALPFAQHRVQRLERGVGLLKVDALKRWRSLGQPGRLIQQIR